MIASLKTLLILSPTMALLVAAGWFLSKPTPEAEKPQSKLLVIVVFDQMRGDYLDRWATAFGADGFEKMKADGAWYANVELPYACSATAPGHASIATGANPSVHGIVENAWLDRDRGLVFCETDETGPRPVLGSGKILAPTISDSLKAATNGVGKYYSISVKGRAAAMLGGKSPTGMFCYSNGIFHGTPIFGDDPAWVQAFNSKRIPLDYSNRMWERFAKADYDKLAGPDDQPGEITPGRTLPRRLPQANEPGFHAAFEGSPFSNELLWNFAKAAIEAENLGQRQTTDILAMSFSANDLIGHSFGPDSHEVLDITLRADAIVAEIIRYLDDRLGRDGYTLMVTADHGIPPLPEVAIASQPKAARIRYSEFVNGLDAVLDETFGKIDGQPGKWIHADDLRETMPWIHLRRDHLKRLDVPYEKVEAFAANWLSQRPGVMQVFRRSKLLDGDCPLPEDRPLFDLVRNGFHPQRCGDLYIVYQPHIHATTALGVSHGTLHDYDRRVFILALGHNVPKAGKQSVKLNWLSFTPMACKAIGIDPPSKSIRDLPDDW